MQYLLVRQQYGDVYVGTYDVAADPYIVDCLCCSQHACPVISAT